jgi:flagellar biosynthesis protein FlhG
MDRALFLGVGDHRRLFRELEHEELPSKLGDIVRSLKSLGSSYVLVDCRGGIDPESLAICSAVDEIILVAEADTTSFQASQHVVDILNAHQLGTKLRGFIINKVIDDPSVVIRTGTSVFRCTNLGAVPFDLEATRAFLIGELPPLRSPFLVHTWAAVQKLAPGDVPEPPGRPWTRREFREIGFANLESVRGGAVLAGVLFLICVLLPLSITSADRVFGLRVYDMLVISGLTLGLLGCFEPFRRALGKIVLAYVDVLSRRLK